jgi:hypothetical protein
MRQRRIPRCSRTRLRKLPATTANPPRRSRRQTAGQHTGSKRPKSLRLTMRLLPGRTDENRMNTAIRCPPAPMSRSSRWSVTPEVACSLRSATRTPCPVITGSTRGRHATTSTACTNRVVEPKPLSERPSLHAHRVVKRRRFAAISLRRWTCGITVTTPTRDSAAPTMVDASSIVRPPISSAAAMWLREPVRSNGNRACGLARSSP